MVIFHSYVSLPGGNQQEWGVSLPKCSIFYDVTLPDLAKGNDVDSIFTIVLADQL